jgi:hypothetical protein
VFWNPFTRKPVPLTGAPATRRVKSYSAQTGYAYQYQYEGHRPLRSGGETGTEFVFRYSPDRKYWHDARVHLYASALAEWERTSGRMLSATEHYAIAKMALAQAFDERAPEQMAGEIVVRPADVKAIIETLGL